MTTPEHFRKLESIANALKLNTFIIPQQLGPSFSMVYHGFVQPKERARGENFYTPTKTRDFEAKVKKQAALIMRRDSIELITRPVFISLQIRDKRPPDFTDWMIELTSAGLIFSTKHGDTDNKEKAILDALNKVVYKDDRLVVKSNRTRVYAPEAGFSITVKPIGLTKSDVDNIRKLLQ